LGLPLRELKLIAPTRFVSELPADEEIRDGGRQRAAPHIKTYIRYDENKSSADWALVTSANLSKQAWGEAANTTGEMRIASYEIGVLVWPALYGQGVKMVPCFQTDEPSRKNHDEVPTVIGLRIPYSLPLQRYGKGEIPWVATASHSEPDRFGRTWEES
jgi:tyrosyl-DNA phosphodiesterase-1